VKLQLDEHLSPRIAERLRTAGHDAVAVAERDDLRGRPDEEVWEAAVADGRALVTGDLADFIAFAAGSPGVLPLILVSRRRFPRSVEGIGRVVAALEALLASTPSTAPIHWLEPPD
jgi:hypothetical protein